MRRERERKQWERDAEDELDEDKPVGPVHYQEVRAGEVRTHGTAYYAFSVDEEKRREQIGLLNKLREQVRCDSVSLCACVHTFTLLLLFS